jgi:hypothetical protein
MSSVTIHNSTGAVSIHLTKDEARTLCVNMGCDSHGARKERGMSDEDSKTVYTIYDKLANALENYYGETKTHG